MVWELLVGAGQRVGSGGPAEGHPAPRETFRAGPANADRFFDEGMDLLVLGMDNVFSLNPVELVGHEVFGQIDCGFDVEGGQDGWHVSRGSRVDRKRSLKALVAGNSGGHCKWFCSW